MIKIRIRCKNILEPFIQAYSALCDDLSLDSSKSLYIDVYSNLLEGIPDKTTQLPFKLKDRKVQEILEASIKSSKKSSRDAASLALQRMITLCKKHGLIDGRVTLNKRFRRDELSIHDKTAFALLDDFIEVRKWLCNRIQVVPRKRKDLAQLSIASLIAVNGVCASNAHLRISSCQCHHLNHSSNYAILDVPTSNYCSKTPPVTRYPLLPEIEKLLALLKSDGHWLYPSNFNPDTWNHKGKRINNMNKWLIELWGNVFGQDCEPPKQWNIRTFISCSKLFFALNTSPIVVGFLSGKSTFASIDTDNPCMESDDSYLLKNNDNEYVAKEVDATTILLAKEVIAVIRSHFKSYHHKLQSKKTKRNASTYLLAVSAVYADLLRDFPCLFHLIRWMVNELDGDGCKRRMGTLRALWNFIPLSLLNELGTEDPTLLDNDQWLRLAEYLIQENSYSPSTRSKIKQHLKHFHEYLCKEHPHMARLNWRRAELKVYSEQGSGIFPLLSEFDLLFKEAGKESNPLMRTQLQATLSLSFFGGLRAEEICLLSKIDIDMLTIQIRIWWSKTRQGRRRLPLFLLTPKKYLTPILNLENNCETRDSLLFQNVKGEQISPDALGKRIKKLIQKVLSPERNMSIHTFRHGFASWLLIRYMVMHEPELLSASYANGNPIIPNSDHEVFSQKEQIKLARVFNGKVAGKNFKLSSSSFLTKPEHFAHISKLIGHATRGTTARTYVHSMEWVSYYYLNKLKCAETS